MNYRKSAIVGVFLGVFLLNTLPHVYAINVTMEYNTDFCGYDDIKDEDYCKTEYKICDVVFDENKTDFLYKEENGEYKFEMESDKLTTEIKIEEEAGCYKVEIEGYKNPFLNIDNVLCYDDECFYQWVWWNSSFQYKYQFTGHYNNNYTDFIYVNDNLGVDLDDGEQYVVCKSNVTHFYYNDSSTYRCVNDTSLAVSEFMLVLEGNESTYGINDPTLPTSWWDLNDSIDSIQNNNLTPINFPNRIIGRVGHGFDLNVANNSYFDTGISSIDRNFTIMCWVRMELGGGVVFGKKGIGQTEFVGFSKGASNGVWTVRVGDGSWNDFETTIQINDSKWHHVAISDNNSRWTGYVDGKNETSGTLIRSLQVSNLELGNIGDGTSPMEGIIDECIFSDRVLSSTEILGVYNNTIPGVSYAQLFNLTTIIPPPPPANITLNETARFCYNNNSLFIRDKDVSDSGSAVFNPYLIRCDYGCSNFTIINLGYPGCRESEFLINILIMIFAAVVILIIRGVFK
jgi:hypothetical protein